MADSRDAGCLSESIGQKVMSAVLTQFGESGVALKCICDADPQFADFLVGLDRPGLHYVCLIVAHAEHKKKWAENWSELGRLLRLRKRKSVIRLICGSCPAGTITALGKMGRRPYAGARYIELFSLLSNRETSKYLRHAASISPSLIRLLATSDTQIRLPYHTLRSANPESIETFNLAVESIKELRPELTDDDLEASLKKGSRSDGFSLAYWFDRLISRAPFPPPPWAGTSELVPLQSAEEMNSASRRFRNCLNSQSNLVLEGDSYFYVWHGREEAVVQLRRSHRFGWGVYEILGKRNRNVSIGTRTEILRTLSKFGITKWRSLSGLFDRLVIADW